MAKIATSLACKNNLLNLQCVKRATHTSLNTRLLSKAHWNIILADTKASLNS